MDIEKEEKTDDRTEQTRMSNPIPQQPQGAAKPSRPEPLTVIKALVGDCLCQGAFPFADNRGLSQNSQFINVHGIEFIGLGAVVDELTPKERVYDTLEQLTTRTERLISIGYLSFEEPKDNEGPAASGDPAILLETVPLDVWNKTYPNDQSMSRRVKRMINNIKVCHVLQVATFL
jgi:hypothetical protein